MTYSGGLVLLHAIQLRYPLLRIDELPEAGMLGKGIFYLQIFFFLFISLAVALPAVEARLIGRQAPEISNEVWINSPPLRMADLRGKVVLMEFWTYG